MPTEQSNVPRSIPSSELALVWNASDAGVGRGLPQCQRDSAHRLGREAVRDREAETGGIGTGIEMLGCDRNPDRGQ